MVRIQFNTLYQSNIASKINRNYSKHAKRCIQLETIDF